MPVKVEVQQTSVVASFKKRLTPTFAMKSVLSYGKTYKESFYLMCWFQFSL